jgi:hypothetical protein
MHQIAFVRRDILLDGVISFLVVAIITGHNGNAPGTLLLPLLTTLDVLPSTLDDSLGWCSSASTGSCFHVA